LLAWRGDFPAAWPELECHWLDERLHFRERFPDLPEWNGEPIDGSRLLIVHGQGLGDYLQMIRYVPQVRERCAEILLECPAPLLGLMRSLPDIAEVFVAGSAPRARFDAFARAMTLARLCNEDGAPGHSGVPYLRAGALSPALAARIGPRDGRLRAGIAWAGNPVHQNDRRRSIPLAEFAPFADVANTQWFSLQYGPRAGDDAPSGLTLTRFGDAIGDMSDTAAIVAQLDVVICADTGVAHLAGALGVPVWLLLPRRPDWRWSPSAADSPWYPSMRLFHAGEPSWKPVIQEAAGALAALATTKAKR
jgi:hypothetical protein